MDKIVNNTLKREKFKNKAPTILKLLSLNV